MRRFVYEGKLGDNGGEVTVWAPTAQSVELLHYAKAEGGEGDVLPMQPGDRGQWSCTRPPAWDKHYYRFRYRHSSLMLRPLLSCTATRWFCAVRMAAHGPGASCCVSFGSSASSPAHAYAVVVPGGPHGRLLLQAEGVSLQHAACGGADGNRPVLARALGRRRAVHVRGPRAGRHPDAARLAGAHIPPNQRCPAASSAASCMQFMHSPHRGR